MIMAVSTILYPIKEAARLLDRSPHTLRSWDRHDGFPQELRAPRNDLGQRVYSPELIEKIRTYLAEADFRPGSGITNYNPDAEARKAHLESLRAAASKRGPMKALVSGTEGNVLAFLNLVGPSTVHQLSGSLGIPPGQMRIICSNLIDSDHVTVDADEVVRPIDE